MSTHVPGFQSFFKFFLYNFTLAKLATYSSIIMITYEVIIQSMEGQDLTCQVGLQACMGSQREICSTYVIILSVGNSHGSGLV